MNFAFFNTYMVLQVAFYAVLAATVIGSTTLLYAFTKAAVKRDDAKLGGMTRRLLVVLGIAVAFGAIFFFMGRYQIK